jgi:hypothetical protein
VQVAGLPLQPEAADHASLDGGEGPAVAGQLVAYVDFGLFERPAGRIEPTVGRECALGKAVEVGCGFCSAGRDLQAGYAAFTAATSLVSESFASPKSMIVLGS